MSGINTNLTDTSGFYRGNKPQELLERFGSPLYVYSESILRERCREMRSLVAYKSFRVNYSAKANANVRLLEIIREEGLDADAMSPGEILTELRAGFQPSQIFFISNNVDAGEMRFAVERGIKVSVDSLSQLELFGMHNPGGSVAVRINPGVGAGHHKSVVTGGKDTKFGVNMEYLPVIKEIAAKYGLRIIGLNSHIGSLFMEGTPYMQAVHAVTEFAKNFEDLEFLDFGGGFGVPYKKLAGERRLVLDELGTRLTEAVNNFVREYGKEIIVKIEPGRYIAAECGVLLGTVHAVKQNGSVTYAGTDIGFNALLRPALYDSHHDIEAYTGDNRREDKMQTVTVVGNICETGDILAKDRELPALRPGDALGVLDAGAYGYSMSSNYNQRLRPAEVLIQQDGVVRLIRPRDTLEDLLAYLDKEQVQ